MITSTKYVQIIVAVPIEAADRVRTAIGQAGGGRQGNYDYTSGSVKQVGRFRPLSGAHPAIGRVGQVEEVEEERIETICETGRWLAVVETIKKAHPYEEPAIAVVPVLYPS